VSENKDIHEALSEEITSRPTDQWPHVRSSNDQKYLKNYIIS